MNVPPRSIQKSHVAIKTIPAPMPSVPQQPAGEQGVRPSPNWWGPGGFFRRAPFMHQPACKPGSVRGKAKPCPVTTIPLGRRLPGASSNLPGRPDPDTGPGIAPAPSLFGFAPGGVCRAVAVARNAVRSYRTFSPLPRPQPWRFVLCGTVPEVSPLARKSLAGRYPAPHVHGARTFLPGDLSVLAGAAVRPTDM